MEKIIGFIFILSTLAYVIKILSEIKLWFSSACLSVACIGMAFLGAVNKNDAWEVLANVGLAIATGFMAWLHYRNGE